MNDENSLKKFTLYIEEYCSHSMKISEVQEKYIKEEVIADVMADEKVRIQKETGRFILTKEEYHTISWKAVIKAEELVHRQDNHL